MATDPISADTPGSCSLPPAPTSLPSSLGSEPPVVFPGDIPLLGLGRPPLAPTKPEPGRTPPTFAPCCGEGCSPPCPSGPTASSRHFSFCFLTAVSTGLQNRPARKTSAADSGELGMVRPPERERGVGQRGLAAGCITRGSWTSPSICPRIHSSRGRTGVLPVHLLAPRPSTPSGPRPNPRVVTTTGGKGDGSDRPSCGEAQTGSSKPRGPAQFGSLGPRWSNALIGCFS